jgi:hypothetical protein
MSDYEREAVALERFAEFLENPAPIPIRMNRRLRLVQKVCNDAAQNARNAAAAYRKGIVP